MTAPAPQAPEHPRPRRACRLAGSLETRTGTDIGACLAFRVNAHTDARRWRRRGRRFHVGRVRVLNSPLARLSPRAFSAAHSLAPTLHSPRGSSARSLSVTTTTSILGRDSSAMPPPACPALCLRPVPPLPPFTPPSFPLRPLLPPPPCKARHVLLAASSEAL